MAAVFREASGMSEADLRAGLARFMGRAFERDRAEDERRIAALLSAERAPREATAPTVVAPRSSRSLWPIVLAGAGVVALALAAVVVLALQSTPPASASSAGPERSEVPPETVPIAVEAEAPGDGAPAPVAFEVDSSVRLVLVDGVVHEERPLLVDLGDDGAAEIRLVGRDREHRTTVTAGDRDRRLELPRARRSRAASTERRPSKTGLLDVPL
jgi:hypothetical protein